MLATFGLEKRQHGQLHSYQILMSSFDSTLLSEPNHPQQRCISCVWFRQGGKCRLGTSAPRYLMGAPVLSWYLPGASAPGGAERVSSYEADAQDSIFFHEDLDVRYMKRQNMNSIIADSSENIESLIHNTKTLEEGTSLSQPSFIFRTVEHA